MKQSNLFAATRKNKGSTDVGCRPLTGTENVEQPAGVILPFVPPMVIQKGTEYRASSFSLSVPTVDG